jgi:hypothetical protein
VAEGAIGEGAASSSLKNVVLSTPLSRVLASIWAPLPF